MTSLSATERAALADALAAAGPDAPTLCAGWTAHDLAAHLVARERRPDAGPGILVPALAGHTERVRRSYRRRPFDELVDTVRNGPNGWARLPGVDALVNVTEHVVHCEDVRRGTPGWQPRALSPELERALWSMVSKRGRMLFRRSPVGVTVADLSGRIAVAVDREPKVTIVGPPAELLLFAFGRTDHALVELDGPEEAVLKLRATELGV